MRPLLFFLLLPMLTPARAGVIVEYTYYVQEPLEVVVLNFWFVNCPPCREEIPLLNRVAEK